MTTTPVTPVLPPVSPPFISADDAAYWAHRQARRSDKEYGSLILKRPDGNYVATTPLKGEADAFDFERLLKYDRVTRTFSHPPGYRCIAFFHSHPEYEQQTARKYYRYTLDQVRLRIALPSTTDFANAYRHVQVLAQSYISSPYGSLIGYSLNPRDPADPPVYGITAPPQTRVRQLVAQGRLWVLDPGSIWGGLRGVVSADWVPFVPVSDGRPSLQPFCTPVFNDPSAAMNAALNSAPVIEGLNRVGFILKREDREEYVATLPRQITEKALLVEEVFPPAYIEYQLPAHYSLYGSYPDPYASLSGL